MFTGGRNINGNGLVAGCQLFYRKIYGYILQCMQERRQQASLSLFYKIHNNLAMVGGGSRRTRPQSYKTFSMLHSIEHGISHAHKCKNIEKFSFFSGSDQSRMLFFLLINVKMPTIVGILTFMHRKNFMLS